MPIPLLIPAALSAVNMVGKFISGAKQKKEANKINPVFNQYQTSPYAQKQLGIAQQMFGGRMAGAPQLERNIFANQATRLGGLQRNATDSSQLLSLGAQSQGMTNDALEDLQIREAQNKQMMLQNLNQAYGTMIGEGNKEYESMKYKFETDAARKDDLMKSAAANKYGAVSDLASMGFQMAGIPGSQMFGNLFKGGGPLKQFGGSGMNPIPYGASVYNKLTAPRPTFGLGGITRQFE